MEVGKNILKIRKENNLTQDELAEKYFVTRQTVSNWETGKNYPDLETLVKISDDFNISLDILLKEDKQMQKNIDSIVKTTKKYKSLLKYIIVFSCLLLFVSYKCIMLKVYQWNKVDINKDAIFNETLTINNIDYNGNRISIDNMFIANFFDGYVDVNNNTNLKIRYDKNGKVASFYSIRVLNQYVNVLNEESFEKGMDSSNGALTITTDSTKKYLNNHDIKNDIDLLNYIKKNYYFENNIFTFTRTMKNNYLLNFFTDVVLLDYENIVLINGNINGYIISAKYAFISEIKEVHILHDNKQYIISLCGDEITSNEFIKRLLSSITFN